MKPKAPRKIFVMVNDEIRPFAEALLRKMATITAIIPPSLTGYPYRYELENPDWPAGDFNQASVILHESRDGNTATIKAEIVMV